MTPELSNAIACATGLRGQIKSEHFRDNEGLRDAIDDFLTRAFRGDNTTWEQRFNEMVTICGQTANQRDAALAAIEALKARHHSTPPLKNRSDTHTSHTTTHQHPMSYDLIAHLQDQILFSERTFGPGARASGIIDHIRKELTEIEKAPHDLEEWIDVILLGLDGAWRSLAAKGGFVVPNGDPSYPRIAELIVEAMRAKLEKNKARQWPDWRTAPEGKAIEHVREEQSSPTIVHASGSLDPIIEDPNARRFITPLLEWDEKWTGDRQPEKRGYMRGDRSITMFILIREVHGAACELQGAFVPDKDEINGLNHADEIDAKAHAEALTFKWLTDRMFKAPHSHAPAPEHTPHSS